MCGRFIVFSDVENREIQEILREVQRRSGDISQLQGFREGEIRPTELAPVLVAGKTGAPCATVLPWGYPQFQGSGVIINARSETAGERPMFRRSIPNRRCIVPTCGFYEWRHEEGRATKDRYLFRLPGAPVLYLAGLYDEFSRPDQSVYRGFVILTTAPNDSMREYHNRMPLVVRREDIRRWLTDEQYARAHLLGPCMDMLSAESA